jgi:hypothetical protein
MKKFVVMAMIFAAAVVFAGETKAIVFGLVDINGNEFTNENIGGVTFKAWLQQGTGPSVNYNEVLTQADFGGSVMMYPDPIENPLRGVAMVDLQYFTTWGAGNILTIEMKDYNVASYCQISAQYTILDLSVEVVELGFEDLGLVGSGMPFQFSFITGGGDIKTFVYPCVTTAGTDYNVVGLPVETGWTKGSDFDPSGTNIESVSRFDTAAQMAETGVYSPVFGWCKDIPVQTGGVYSISAKNNFDFTVTGDSVNFVYDFITTAGTDYNHFVHPLTKAGLTTSAMLGNDIGTANCNAIAKWDAATQTMQTSAYVLTQWTNTFSTSPGQPLAVNMKTNITWPTGKDHDGNFISEESTSSEKNAKGGNAKARIAFYHLVNDSGIELTEEEMKLIQFDAYIVSRPTEVLTENGYDCGFMKIGGHSVAYVNLANFTTPWASGDVLYFKLTNFMPMEGYELSLTIDNSSSTIYKGFEPIIAGSGAPGYLDMSAVVPLTGVDVAVREESGNIVLEWGWAGENVTGYNIYSSDEPYSTFSYITTTSNLSWSTAASENRKFFYVVSTNAKSSVPPKTITVKEKK